MRFIINFFLVIHTNLLIAMTLQNKMNDSIYYNKYTQICNVNFTKNLKVTNWKNAYLMYIIMVKKKLCMPNFWPIILVWNGKVSPCNIFCWPKYESIPTKLRISFMFGHMSNWGKNWQLLSLICCDSDCRISKSYIL